MADSINYQLAKFRRQLRQGFADPRVHLSRGELRWPLKCGQVVHHEQAFLAAKNPGQGFEYAG